MFASVDVSAENDDFGFLLRKILRAEYLSESLEKIVLIADADEYT